MRPGIAQNTSCAGRDSLYIATTNLPFLERRGSTIVYTCTYMYMCTYTEAPRSEILHVPIVYMLGQTCTYISIRLVILGLKHCITERPGLYLFCGYNRHWHFSLQCVLGYIQNVLCTGDSALPVNHVLGVVKYTLRCADMS